MTASQSDVDKVMAAFGAAPITYRPSQEAAEGHERSRRCAASARHLCRAIRAIREGGGAYHARRGRTRSRDFSVALACHSGDRRAQDRIDTETRRRSGRAAEGGARRSASARRRAAGARRAPRTPRTGADQARRDGHTSRCADTTGALGAAGPGGTAERTRRPRSGLRRVGISRPRSPRHPPTPRLPPCPSGRCHHCGLIRM